MSVDQLKRYTITLDDDPIVHKFVEKVTGMSTVPFTSAEKLLGRASSYEPMAVFVDIHLGHEVTGLDILPQLRQAWPYVPILVITGDDEKGLIGRSLATGANDFLKKPIAVTEFTARLQARIAEMSSRKEIDELHIGDVILNKKLKSLTCMDKTTYLSRLEADLLQFLAENRGMLTPKENLGRHLWGKINVSTNSIDKRVSNVRKALADIGSSVIVQSIYGRGVSIDDGRFLPST